MTIPSMAAPAELDRILLALSTVVCVLLVLSLAFAAVTVAIHQWSDVRTRQRRQLESTWREPLLEVIDGEVPPTSIHALVAPRDALYFVGFVLRFDRVLGGKEHDVLRAVVAPYLPALVPAIRRGSPERRARAVQTLARFGLPEHAQTVVGTLDDPSPFVAMIAARGLFRRDYPEHFVAVLSRLDRFSAWSRGYLVRMMTAGGVPAAPLLRDLMTDGERDANLRAAAADALRSLGDLQAVERAADLLDEGLPPELAIACLRLLSHAGHGVHAALARRYSKARDTAVRSAALAALGSVGDDHDAPLLREHVGDASPWVALTATRALFELAGPAELTGISGEGPGVRTLIRQVLAEASWA